nr:reverse transcriptase domain-containing protein [Tanacetum cinerariifolium]
LPPESIDSYKNLKAAFLAYFMQQKKYVKDPVEIHNIKQKDEETIEDFMEHFKVETGRMKGAPECMRISGFMHVVNNPELTKRLNEHVPKTMEEMMITTLSLGPSPKSNLVWTSFCRSRRTFSMIIGFQTSSLGTRREYSSTRITISSGRKVIEGIVRLTDLAKLTCQARPNPKPRGDSRDHPRGRSRPHRLDTSNEDRPKDRERFRSVGESYDDYFSHSYHDGNCFCHMKRQRDSESLLSSVSKSDSSNRKYRRSRSKRHKSTDEEDLTRPWMCEEEDPFTHRIRNFESSRRTRMPNNIKTYNGTGDPKDHVKIFQAATQVERWVMPTCIPGVFHATKEICQGSGGDPKQKDGETIEDFMKRFKVETGRIKGAPECMRISGFMHGENNPELTKRLNEHVPKTMEEIMITTIAFIRGEAAMLLAKRKVMHQGRHRTSPKGKT